MNYVSTLLSLLFHTLSYLKQHFCQTSRQPVVTDGLFTEKSCRECYIITFQWRILDMLFIFSIFF